ncbi:nitroreductase family deazaflavin-dependent oxidoreductase [Kribbella shirazensis]|uniref:Deazaflavin-dependent oxidoreductase (Nitroreductase family) n=1 Tax=Kribbella shirazensis TaxID=1105143 RepID=A0A7X5VIP0_9ACTN|nr:nitroreductase family deazaflavin-dependent oxidoreductase [Kribbella shirazensis]NIK61980.1 deazaflavin-dependent oxidoreductase (nitroreductase family) [Kribbella shirazensis]
MTSNAEEYAPSPAAWVRDSVDKVTEAGTTDVIDVHGLKVVVLTTRGAKSGKIRKSPLMRVEHDGVYLAVGSNSGSAKNPVWYYNLKADPAVTVQDGEVTHGYLAREVEGAEYEVWWERAVAVFPAYADYQAMTTRKIPLFVLEPVA